MRTSKQLKEFKQETLFQKLSASALLFIGVVIFIHVMLGAI